MIRLVLSIALMALVFASTGSSQCASPGSDMAAWWDASLQGAQARDLIGDHPAELNSGAGVAAAPGFSSEVFAFDGVDDYADAGSAVLAGGLFSAECWLRATSTGTTRGLDRGDRSDGRVGGGAVRRPAAQRQLPIEFLRRTSMSSATRVLTPPVPASRRVDPCRGDLRRRIGPRDLREWRGLWRGSDVRGFQPRRRHSGEHRLWRERSGRRADERADR